MTYPIAWSDVTDVRIWLNTDIMDIDTWDDDKEQQQAVNIIISRLYGRIPSATLNAWVLPNVPLIIRGIAGRLVAALVYSRQSTGDEQEVDPYARMLYQTAIGEIDGILTGRLVIPELVDSSVEISDSGHLSDAMYDSNITPPMFDQCTEY